MGGAADAGAGGRQDRPGIRRLSIRASEKGPAGSFLFDGEERKEEARIGQEQRRGTALIQSTVHRGTKILPFFAKRKRKRRGGQASVPLHPLLPAGCPPRTPPWGEGFYVSSVIMLLGPPGTIPRRAFCCRCVGDMP